VDEKSNEITAIPELLRVLELKGCIVTIDAMGCQKEIAAQIIEERADYVLALKSNHSTANKDFLEYFNDAVPAGSDANTPRPQSKGKRASSAGCFCALWTLVSNVLPRPSVAIGASKTACTGQWTLPSGKTKAERVPSTQPTTSPRSGESSLTC
jgi:hypothetical protein